MGDRVDVGQTVGEVGGEQHDEAADEELSREDLSCVEAEMWILIITSQTPIFRPTANSTLSETGRYGSDTVG